MRWFCPLFSIRKTTELAMPGNIIVARAVSRNLDK